MTEYALKTAALRNRRENADGQVRLGKSTVSNLFRYKPRERGAHQIPLGHFNEIIGLDADAGTLDVEGLATFETIVAYCLPRGFLPPVTPELKHITIGGATVGIGIESTGFRHGFVHDALLEADVLLPGGEVVTCSPDNTHGDLFRALPNSYGTLGYILRARIRLEPARPRVHLQVERFDQPGAYLDAMLEATRRDDLDFVEGLFFEDGRFYLMTSRFCEETPRLDDILREHIFYRLVQSREDIWLATADYIFRYDPEWFWNIPDSPVYTLFRRHAPARFRNSGFYTRYAAWKTGLAGWLPGRDRMEPLIQDWEVPWDRAAELIDFSLREVKLDGRPWAAVPIRPVNRATLYPVEPGELLFNLGCYCQVQRPDGAEPWHYSRIMDRKCFDLGGIKMLYSSTFLDKSKFDARFNGEAYHKLKAKYDPGSKAPFLYEKVSI